MNPIRNSAKAIIIQAGQVLLTKNKDATGYFYIFPGGGQERGETLVQAVKRECMEEIGQDVEVGELAHVREYIGKNHEYAEWDGATHQVEFYFQCTLKSSMPGEAIGNGINPDDYQIGVEWVPLDRLHEYSVYPRALIPILQGGAAAICYLGDTN
ncbi:8-oxo-dGTP pyrophosphatase MutT (NUDIX family) [Paenibacillus phyllosphaerae]|uniref:8-oxo-dGTP pyrophosphatase MutT (NUDIX family) n=1 Tax=Paenibacillus phyllosphaerae TaxID=274593 RepID=A0A7W5FMH0_9BACL|nr:NUDIX domain-containing protein [Paenibacillus phyllosphaerae]MBB3110261.1 8-oxo-dGTP pyrophosphatase MutT (NUDIX family) [Paenibacillus phyllosphaerae]